ncbi:hypothetical protein CEV33_2960 [Brucella grignonensis]|uniref:Uncharacterized protein n=1 Tax=Brucella grignonensis TaxID=94627 RepID=A0A256F483_9HYPH|nr:hypothetical protein CEV33_2960 [Brucella grignonensis]
MRSRRAHHTLSITRQPVSAKSAMIFMANGWKPLFASSFP